MDRGLSVKLDGRQFALFRIGGDYYALDGECPHRGGPLGEGLIENGQVYCPMHGWRFDAKTGACVDNPNKPVRCFRTRVVDGFVQIEL